MQLRLRLGHFSVFRRSGNLLHSAKEIGLWGYGSALFLSLVLHIITPAITWNAPLFYVLGIAAIGSYFLMPKRRSYAASHFLLISSASLFHRGPLRQRPVSQNKLFDIRIAPREKPHFIFLFLESFPAKYISSKTTPHFERLKKGGIFFSNFYSNGTLTYRAMISGLFGMPPATTAVGLSPYVNVPFTGLPQAFKERHYKTAFHHNGSLRFDFQDRFLASHFDEIKDQRDMGEEKSPGWGIPDERLMDYSANWLEKQTGPAFMTLFTITNHHPWILPEGYLAPPGLSRFEQTIHYTDAALGRLISRLEESKLDEKTILFILGDHGQPMGEHENFYNSRFLYEENVRVPLLILAKGRTPPKEIQDVGSQIDLLPTVLDLLGVTQGPSLARLDPERCAFLQNPYSEGFVACRKKQWKWIENRMTEEEELYDLASDPQERMNIAVNHPKISNELKAETHAFFAENEDRYKGLLQRQSADDCLNLADGLITDAKLIGSSRWRKADLSNCHLLTDAGIAAFLACSPELEELILKGVDGLSSNLFSKPHPNLRALNLSAASIKPETIVINCPRLSELELNVKNEKSVPFRNLIRLKLFEADNLDDVAFFELVRNNPDLGRLAVHGCGKMSDRTLYELAKLPLEQLWLFDAPHLSPDGIAHLNSQKIRSLILR